MKNKKNFIYQIELANLFFLKLILLKSIGFNLNRYLKTISRRNSLMNIKLIKNIIKFLEKGIETKYILKYIYNKTNMPEIKIILEDYEINQKIDEKMIAVFLEKNKYLIENMSNMLNFYYIILTAILYPLPVVLIIISFFLSINSFLLMLLPIFLSVLIIRKMKRIYYE